MIHGSLKVELSGFLHVNSCTTTNITLMVNVNFIPIEIRNNRAVILSFNASKHFKVTLPL